MDVTEEILPKKKTPPESDPTKPTATHLLVVRTRSARRASEMVAPQLTIA